LASVTLGAYPGNPEFWLKAFMAQVDDLALYGDASTNERSERSLMAHGVDGHSIIDPMKRERETSATSRSLNRGTRLEHARQLDDLFRPLAVPRLVSEHDDIS
jgi:hypothetical protein